MKRIAGLFLLGALTIAGCLPVYAQRITPEENARQSRKAAKNQQKMLNKANKRQRKAARKAAKSQQKQMKKANRHKR